MSTLDTTTKVEDDGWLAACHEAAHAVAAHYFCFPALGVSCHATSNGNFQGRFIADKRAFALAMHWVADDPKTLERLVISTCAVLRIGWVADLEIQRINPHREFECSWSDVEQITAFLGRFPQEHRAHYGIQAHRVALELVRRPWFELTQTAIAQQLQDHSEYALEGNFPFPLHSEERLESFGDCPQTNRLKRMSHQLHLDFLIGRNLSSEANRSAERAARYLLNLCNAAGAA